jgi:hypothetical protein
MSTSVANEEAQNVPHHVRMRRAKLKLSETIEQISNEFQLTPSEVFRILAEEISTLANWCIRSERERAKERLTEEDS